MGTPDETHSGRCYCGAAQVTARGKPLVVSYCHCDDCRRVTGAPVGAFAAWAPDDLTIDAEALGKVQIAEGVERQFCLRCGSPLAAWWDYLPGQVYVPVGIMDDAARLAPSRHAHADARLPWLHVIDDLPKDPRSARAGLNAAAGCDA